MANAQKLSDMGGNVQISWSFCANTIHYNKKRRYSSIQVIDKRNLNYVSYALFRSIELITNQIPDIDPQPYPSIPVSCIYSRC